VLLQNNNIAFSAIHDAIDERTFEQVKNIEMTHEVWKKLEESFEGTKAIKGANAYILKEKFASFKMKEDESVSDMFHRMKVLVSDLKALGEKVKDKDFSYKFLRCLPTRFSMLVTLLVRTGLDTMTPILGDIMTDDAYRDDDKKKSGRKRMRRRRVWHSKTTSSSKGKARQDTSSEDDDSSFDDMNDEKMALFVKKFGKFMVKKCYHVRRKKSSSKNKEESRRCFKCGSKDRLIAQCLYNSDNDDDDKKSKKKDKKEKKERKDKMTIKKKKGGSYVVT
jgi:hypothetical protein